MKSLIQTAPSLILKVSYESGEEKTIGYASNLAFTVTQGQKPIFTVDSPFPVEIAQAASASMVSGTMSIYLLKGSTPESVGLVPYRVSKSGSDIMSAATKYCNIRLYSRGDNTLVFSCDYCKVSTYTVAVTAKRVVQVNLNFDGIFLTTNTPV